MGETKVKKYINPITFEAEMFANSLEALSKTHNYTDANLLRSLEKVMDAIERLLDTSQNEILATKATELVACDVKDILKFYRCYKCKMDLGKSAEKVTLHLTNCTSHRSDTETTESNSITHPNTENENKNNKKQKLNDKRNKKKSCPAVKLTRGIISFLTSNLTQFFRENVKIAEKLKIIPEYDEIEEDLLSVITRKYPKKEVNIYQFGSRLSGVGTRNSDLDIFVCIGDCFHEFQSRVDVETYQKLNTVSQALKKSETFYVVEKIQRARVPILRVIHNSTYIKCDISFSNGLAVMNTKYLAYIFLHQPIARSMCIFLKKWLNHTALGDDFNNYQLNLMTVFYLQTLNLLPSLKTSQDGLNPKEHLAVGPWLCEFRPKSMKHFDIPLEEETVGNVIKRIKGFFQFYISFNYEDNIICPYIGQPVKRTEFDSLMPEWYTNYVKDVDASVLKINTAMVVQDPLQLNHNVTKAVTLTKLQLFIEYMRKSVAVLNGGVQF